MQPRGTKGSTSGNDRDAKGQRRELLVTAEAVITEQGFGRTTVEDICARAGVSTQVFYAHFQGLGALLRTLSTNFADQMISVTDQATRTGIWKGAPARDVVEVAVRSILDVVIERQGLVRAFLSHGATDPALGNDLRRIGTHMSERIIATLGECTNVPARPARAVAFSLLLAVALAHHYILVGDEWSGVSFSKEQLAEECSRTICAYLGLQPTISIKEDTPDLARTSMYDAAKTTEVPVIDPELLDRTR